MTDQAKRQSGGGKLTRSETVTVRLDPKLRYLAELAARKQRRTVSSFIEWAIDESFRNVLLRQGSGYNDDEGNSLKDEAVRLWDADEAERFAKLAIHYPELLTHEEQIKWKVLLDSGLLDPARKREARTEEVVWQMDILEDLIFPAMRRGWDSLNQYLENGEAKEWIKHTRVALKKGHVFHNDDDDIDILS